jgi:Arc/MetJ-type ribon-helix-helix transcriptional regulator
MTIRLPEDLERPILAAVRCGRYATLDDAMAEAASLLVKQLEQEQPQASSPDATAHKPIWEVADELRKSIPQEEWDRLPADGASQHDHYIYGTPKRPVT